jgi:hypothetical protein
LYSRYTFSNPPRACEGSKREFFGSKETYMSKRETWKPTRTHDGQDIGGGKMHPSGNGHVGNDISSRIEAQQRKDARR